MTVKIDWEKVIEGLMKKYPKEYSHMELCEIFLDEIIYQQIKLKAIKTIILTPKKIDNLLVVEDPYICLHVYNKTRKRLLQEINEQIVYMWQHYVECNIDTLAEDAKELRANLLATFEKIRRTV